MIVPLFLVLLLGILEFGMVFDHVLTISYATREGARTGAALANGSKMAEESLGTCSDVDLYVVAAVERVLDSPGLAGPRGPRQLDQIRDLQNPTASGGRGGSRQRLDPRRRSLVVDGTELSASSRARRAGILLHPQQRHQQPRLPRRLDLLPLPRGDAAGLAAAVLRRTRLDDSFPCRIAPSWPSTQRTKGNCHGAFDHSRPPRSTRPDPARDARQRSPQPAGGEILVIFAGALIALMALCAVVVDVASYWTNNLRMQRAADTCCTRPVWLPGQPGPGHDGRARRGGQERLHERRGRRQASRPPTTSGQPAPHQGRDHGTRRHACSRAPSA